MNDEEWAKQAVRNMLVRCWARACEVMFWIDEIDSEQ